MNITTWEDEAARGSVLNSIAASLASKEAGVGEEVVKRLLTLGVNATERDIGELLIDLISERGGASRQILQVCLDIGRDPKPNEVEAAVQNLSLSFFNEVKASYPPPTFPASIPKDILSRFVSSDNRTALIVLRFNGSLSEAEERSVIEAIRGVLKETRRSGFTSLLTGPLSLSYDTRDLNTRDIGIIDRVTILLVFLICAALIGSLIVPTFSLLTVGSALAAALGLLALMSQFLIQPYYLLRSMISVVILGAGVDYVIFMVFRYLEERGNQTDQAAAVKRTASHAGGAVALSASTVLIGFLSLTLSSNGILQSIGLGLALGILLTLAGALLTVPSTLALLKDRILWPKKTIPSFAVRIAVFRRMASYCVRNPKKVLAVGLLLTVPLGAVLLTMNLTYSDLEMLPPLESKLGVEAVLSSFGAAPLSKIQVVVLSSEPLFAGDKVRVELYDAVDRLHLQIAGVDGVYSNYTLGPTRPKGWYVPPEEVDRSAVKPFVSEDGRAFVITTSLKSFYGSNEAFTAVKSVREKVAEVAGREAALRGAKIFVGGAAALYYDLTNQINFDFFYIIIPVACIGIFLALLVALGSALIPLRLLATTALSAIWSLSILTLIFQHLFGEKIYWLTPLLAFSVLMGLGTDYDVFLITRVKEEVLKGLSDEEAVVNAVEKTGLVLTAAGLILGSALASLMLSPNLVLKEIGFALSLSIFIDTFFMRIFLNPAIIVVAKKWNWWPRRLRIDSR